MCRFLVSMALIGITSFPLALAAEEQPSTVGMILDVSGSMAGKRAIAMAEAAKLFLATIPPNFEVVIISFNHEATGARFQLRTAAERQAAMRHIDNLKIDGGTNYVSALEAAKLPPGAPAVFLSDGENNTGAEPVLATLKARPPGRLFTIGIEAPPAAAKLLSDMAVITAGSYLKVDDSESLVKAFLDIAKQLGNYRTYLPKEDKIVCKNVVGHLVLFGFDSTPALTASPPLPGTTIFRHHADLPGEKVNVASVQLGPPTSVTVLASQKRTPQGRLAAILRQDLLRAEMQVAAPEGKAAMGGELKASTRFYDSAGQLVDPRKRLDLSAVFQLLDESGRILANVLGKPSATEAALEASIPLPNKAGPIRVKNVTEVTSEGAGYQAEQSRTILLQKPASLLVQPQQIKLAVREGRFTAKLTLKVVHDQPLTATFTAEIEGAVKGIRLLQARSLEDQLEMEFEAVGAGSHRGLLLIQGAAAVPIVPIRVPFEMTVKDAHLGIALPETRILRFGPFLANSRSKQIGTLEVPSLDNEAVSYSVDVEDLSNGSTVIPFTSDQTTINPTKSKPARLSLTAEIGNAPTGEYFGSIIVKPANSDRAKEWRSKVCLTLTEPLAMQPIDFGAVEVGRIVQRSFKLQNAAEAVSDVQVAKASIDAKGGDIIATLPEKFSIGARQQKELPITLTVSPLVESRGVHEGSVIIRRTGKQELTIPFRVTVVDAGKGPCELLAAPGKILIACKRGEVQQFDVRTKFSVGAGAATEELAAEVARFKDAAGKSIDLEVAFKWQPGTKLTRGTPVTVQGFLLAPDRGGVYSSTLTIRSKESGTLVLPLTLEVD